MNGYPIPTVSMASVFSVRANGYLNFLSVLVASRFSKPSSLAGMYGHPEADNAKHTPGKHTHSINLGWAWAGLVGSCLRSAVGADWSRLNPP